MNSLHNQEYKAIIKRLRKARLDLDLSQVEVAKKLKKPQSFVSKVETYQRRLDILEFKQMTKLYKLDPVEVL